MTEEKADHVCNESTFNRIFREYSGDLYKFLYYKFGPDNNPEDLVQEAFGKLWQNCRNVVPAKAKSYLFTVANNQMLNIIDRSKTALRYRQDNVRQEVDHESPDYKMEESEFQEKLEYAINSLTEAQRVAFLLNRIEKKSHKEIAEMLDISRKSVEKRIYGALKKIRNIIDEEL